MKKRLLLWLMLALFVCALTLAPAKAAPALPIAALGDSNLELYQNAATPDMPWTLFAAIDHIELGTMAHGDSARIDQVKRNLLGPTLEDRLLHYGGTSLFVHLVLQDMERLSTIQRILDPETHAFPLPAGTYAYQNTWGAARTYGGTRAHEGIDLIAPKGTPVLSISSGTITRKGWDEKGGWRIGVTDEHGLYYYYAHLSQYAALEIGDTVSPGQVLGYVGSTGYGPEGTDDVMIPHLHIGLYENDRAVNPYGFLRTWEQ